MSPKPVIPFLKEFTRMFLLVWKAGKVLTILSFALKALQAGLPIAGLYFVKDLIDLVTRHSSSSTSDIVYCIVSIFAIQIAGAAVNQISGFIVSTQQQKVTLMLSEMVIGKAIRVKLAFYENPQYHKSFYMAQQQALYKAPALVTLILQFIESSLSIAMLGALFVTLGWLYTLALILIAIPVIAFRWYYGKATYLLERENSEMERRSGLLHHMLTSVIYAKEVRTFGFGRAFLERFTTIRKLLFEKTQTLKAKEARAGFLAQFTEILIVSLLYLKLALETVAGTLTIGTFVLYFQAFQRLQSSLKNWLQTLVQLFQSRIFLRDIFEFLDLPAPTAPHVTTLSPHHITTSLPPSGATSPSLTVTDLSFSYPGFDRKVLNNITFTCRPGELIAFVGENGSGKSTLMKLLCRLYESDEGSIFLNDTPIGSFDDEIFRQLVSVVFQDFGRYFLTVADNITMGAAMDDQKLSQSARRSGAWDFIQAMPGGIDTMLDRSFSNSEEISGGQWQKLALARAFYRNAPITILDEPTSHIDPIAEYELMAGIKRDLGSKIMILVTHRLHNLKIADRIYVMNRGTIVEQGPLGELIRAGGLFSEMYSRQKLV